uniref:Uncharacterized protein n=1 Tax=Plectus sambesii TaxID=2011161 RepID=A0A914XEC4_9BILA
MFSSSLLLATTLIASTLAVPVPLQPLPSSNKTKPINIRINAAFSSSERRSSRDADADHPTLSPTSNITHAPSPFPSPSPSQQKNTKKKVSTKLRAPTPRETDEALIRVATEIQEKASQGQLLLLICKAQCYQQQGQTIAILHDYMSEMNITDPDHIINYYYYFAPDSASQFSIQTLPWPTKFPAFMYIVADRAFQYVGDTMDHDAFKAWLVERHQSTSMELSADGAALNDILDNAALCDGRKWLLLLQDQLVCPMHHWDNIARSLADVANLSIAHIPLHTIMRLQNQWMPEAEAKVIIEQRLPTVDLTGPCAHVLLLQNNAYIRYNGYVTTDSPGHVRRFAIQSHNDWCNGDGWPWRPIYESLSDIELEYFTEEGSIDRLKRKTSYVVIGATGGIAVILLAISIFWGLNSSSFAVSK